MFASQNMKQKKAPVKDGILTDVLKEAGEGLHNRLVQLTAECIWKNDS